MILSLILSTMAFANNYAQVDGNGVVQQVIVADPSVIAVRSGTWIQTDPNGISPKNYAGIGMRFDSGKQCFIPNKPFGSWLLDGSGCAWKAPIEMPSDGNIYRWDEENQEWVQ